MRSRASPSVRLSGHRKLPHPDRDGHPVTQRIVLQDLAGSGRLASYTPAVWVCKEMVFFSYCKQVILFIFNRHVLK